MLYPGFDLRLQQLESNIEKATILIGQYQTELILEDDPQRKGKYKLRIEQLKELIDSYKQELDKLREEADIDQIYKVNKIAVELHEMNDQINALGNLVLRSHTALSKQLNQNQLATVQTIMDALEANRIAEVDLEDLLKNVQITLETAKSKGLSISSAQEEIERVIDDPSIDAKHKIKVSIPIIPLLIDYEAELELGTGFNLKMLWEQWKNRFRKT
jgi:hypothetical protein